MRRALVVGINDYPGNPLYGCINDAVAFGTTLEKNGDGSPNFDVRLLTSDKGQVSTAVLSEAVADLFRGDADIALFYFAGHGIINPDTNAGYIVSQNGSRGAWGMSLSEIVGKANAAYPRIKTTVLIFDSCHSGFAGEIAGLGNEALANIGTGVTILTSCDREGTAEEGSEHGLFTEIFLDALAGSSADIIGRVTPASIYAHVDQMLSSWEQRPIYKANVRTFVTLRHVQAKIDPEILRRLPEFFPNATDVFPLDPSFEPDRTSVADTIKATPINEQNVKVFGELQLCNRYGLVVPVDADHMFFAAINSTSCRLTALGAHYRKLALAGRI